MSLPHLSLALAEADRRGRVVRWTLDEDDHALSAAHARLADMRLMEEDEAAEMRQRRADLES